MDHWTTGMDYWNTGMNYWNTGMDYWNDYLYRKMLVRGKGGAWTIATVTWFSDEILIQQLCILSLQMYLAFRLTAHTLNRQLTLRLNCSLGYPDPRLTTSCAY